MAHLLNFKLLSAGTCAVLLFYAGCDKPIQASNASEVLEAAWSDFQIREFKLAVKKFHAVQKVTPDTDPRHIEALYGEASCWNLNREDRDPTRAGKKFEEVQKLDPTGSFAAWAALDRVRSLHLNTGGAILGDRELAEKYGDVATRYPGSQAATEAMLYASNLRLLSATNRDELLKIEKVLTDFVAPNPGNPYLSQIYGTLQSVYQQLESPDQQLKMALLALEATEPDPTNPKFNFSGNFWGIAQLAQFQAGDFATAREFYNRLINDYPNDQRVFTARRMIAEMDRIEKGGEIK